VSSLATQLLHGDLDEVQCPNCDSPLWVRFAEVVAQCAVRCPACRIRIWLRDERGEIHNAGAVIESLVEQVLKDVR